MIVRATFEVLATRNAYLVGYAREFMEAWPWLRWGAVVNDHLEDDMAVLFARDMREAVFGILSMPRVVRETLLAELFGILETPLEVPHAHNTWYRGIVVDLRRSLPRMRRQIVRLNAGTACPRCEGSGLYKGRFSCHGCEGTALTAEGQRLWAARQATQAGATS